MVKERSSSISKGSKNVRNLIIFLMIILAFLGAVNPDIRGAVFINLIFLGISFIIYQGPEFQDDLIGIRSKGAVTSIMLGIAATVLFFLLTLLVPGLSLGLPLLPAAISDSLRWFLVVIVAPIVESIFFLGAIYAYIRNFTKKNPDAFFKLIIRIILLSALFAVFHVGAYVLGFYQYPSFTSGMTALLANISGFIVAFLFNLVASLLLVWKGVRNLLFAIVFHLGLNFIAFTLSIAIFALSRGIVTTILS